MYVWLPLLQFKVGPIGCWSADCEGTLITTRRLATSRMRLVNEIDGHGFLLYGRVMCQGCMSEKSMIDQDFISLLPKFAQRQLGVFIHGISAYSNTLMDVSASCLAISGEVGTVIGEFKRRRTAEWERRIRAFLEDEKEWKEWKERKKNPLGMVTNASVSVAPRPPDLLGFFDHCISYGEQGDVASGYGGYLGPDQKTFQDALLQWSLPAKEAAIQETMAITAQHTLCSDACHKFGNAVSIQVRKGGDNKMSAELPLTAFHVVANEKAQILQCLPVNTVSNRELLACSKEILERHIMSGAPLPHSWYTDTCCRGENAELEAHFQSVVDNATSLSDEEKNAMLEKGVNVLLDLDHAMRRFSRALSTGASNEEMRTRAKDAYRMVQWAFLGYSTVAGIPSSKEKKSLDPGDVVLGRLVHVMECLRPPSKARPRDQTENACFEKAKEFAGDVAWLEPDAFLSEKERHEAYTDAVENVFESNKRHVLNCLSEPHGVDPLVYDRFNAPSLVRNSSKLENFFKHSQRHFPSKCGIEFAEYCITRFIQEWNSDRRCQFDKSFPYLPLSFDTSCDRLVISSLLIESKRVSPVNSSVSSGSSSASFSTLPYPPVQSRDKDALTKFGFRFAASNLDSLQQQKLVEVSESHVALVEVLIEQILENEYEKMSNAPAWKNLIREIALEPAIGAKVMELVSDGIDDKIVERRRQSQKTRESVVEELEEQAKKTSYRGPNPFKQVIDPSPIQSSSRPSGSRKSKHKMSKSAMKGRSAKLSKERSLSGRYNGADMRPFEAVACLKSFSRGERVILRYLIQVGVSVEKLVADVWPRLVSVADAFRENKRGGLISEAKLKDDSTLRSEYAALKAIHLLEEDKGTNTVHMMATGYYTAREYHQHLADCYAAELSSVFKDVFGLNQQPRRFEPPPRAPPAMLPPPLFANRDPVPLESSYSSLPVRVTKRKKVTTKTTTTVEITSLDEVTFESPSFTKKPRTDSPCLVELVDSDDGDGDGDVVVVSNGKEEADDGVPLLSVSVKKKRRRNQEYWTPDDILKVTGIVHDCGGFNSGLRNGTAIFQKVLALCDAGQMDRKSCTSSSVRNLVHKLRKAPPPRVSSVATSSSRKRVTPAPVVEVDMVVESSGSSTPLVESASSSTGDGASSSTTSKRRQGTIDGFFVSSSPPSAQKSSTSNVQSRMLVEDPGDGGSGDMPSYSLFNSQGVMLPPPPLNHNVSRFGKKKTLSVETLSGSSSSRKSKTPRAASSSQSSPPLSYFNKTKPIRSPKVTEDMLARGIEGCEALRPTQTAFTKEEDNLLLELSKDKKFVRWSRRSGQGRNLDIGKLKSVFDHYMRIYIRDNKGKEEKYCDRERKQLSDRLSRLRQKRN